MMVIFRLCSVIGSLGLWVSTRCTVCRFTVTHCDFGPILGFDRWAWRIRIVGTFSRYMYQVVYNRQHSTAHHTTPHHTTIEEEDLRCTAITTAIVCSYYCHCYSLRVSIYCFLLASASSPSQHIT